MKKIIFFVFCLILASSAMAEMNPDVNFKQLYYSDKNKGVFYSGYYFPSLKGAMESLCYGNTLMLEPNTYVLPCTVQLEGSNNHIDGQGSTLRMSDTAEKKDIAILQVEKSSILNTIKRFCFDVRRGAK